MQKINRPTAELHAPISRGILNAPFRFLARHTRFRRDWFFQRYVLLPMSSIFIGAYFLNPHTVAIRHRAN